MKRIALLTIAVFMVMVFAGVSFADKENTGCGIGYMIFEGKEGILSQICAVTTNGTFGNQTFGITSGTLECEQPATFAENKKLNQFVADNMDNLAKDIAQGNGEYLNTLAVLMEVPESKRASFYASLQAHFAQIYTSGGVTHADVVRNIVSVVPSS